MPKISTEDFLKLMSQLESSGNKDTNHKPSTHGANPGDTAVGQYGLMPQTSYEVLHPPGGQRFPTDPNLMNYSGLDKDQLSSEIAKNPQLEHGIADQYAKRVLNHAQSPDAAAAMWNSGPNHPFSQDELNNMPRIQKFQQLRNSLQSPSIKLPANIPEDQE